IHPPHLYYYLTAAQQPRARLLGRRQVVTRVVGGLVELGYSAGNDGRPWDVPGASVLRGANSVGAASAGRIGPPQAQLPESPPSSAGAEAGAEDSPPAPSSAS